MRGCTSAEKLVGQWGVRLPSLYNIFRLDAGQGRGSERAGRESSCEVHASTVNNENKPVKSVLTHSLNCLYTNA